MTDPDSDKFETVGPWKDDAPLPGAMLLPVDPEGRFLLQLRDYGTTRYPGRWGFFGGQVEAGETLRQAVVREFEEEAGIAIDPAAPRPLFRFTAPATGSHLYLFVAELDVKPAENPTSGRASKTPTRIGNGSNSGCERSVTASYLLRTKKSSSA